MKLFAAIAVTILVVSADTAALASSDSEMTRAERAELIELPNNTSDNLQIGEVKTSPDYPR